MRKHATIASSTGATSAIRVIGRNPKREACIGRDCTVTLAPPMRWPVSILAALLGPVLLAGCAQLSNVLSDVKPGMDRREALANVDASPRSFRKDCTEYLVYRFGVSFSSLYSDHPWTLYFVKLVDGRVVQKGVLGAAEEQALREIDPHFDRERLEARSGVDPAGA
jgi:hypothetical protein